MRDFILQVPTVAIALAIGVLATGPMSVHQALLLGLLKEGDKLPTVKEVVAKVAINPNTVSKAYRELEHLGLAAANPGVGTFITQSRGHASLAEHGPLQQELRAWLERARAAGLTEPGIDAMFQNTRRESAEEEI